MSLIESITVENINTTKE